MKFLDILESVLKEDSRFIADDGRLLKTEVYNACMAFDENLLSLLMKNGDTKSHFFKEVNNALVFDKIKFTWVLESREFLPDSYTMYKNKIGLTNGSGEFISQSDDVSLVWPYKDCILEGGQTKDDQKRDEIFYNETLAPDEVNRLLYPKVFTNAKRYSKGGTEDITQFDENDNLIIKGNNLLALSSLLKRYEGKVKCIYIDPPYNTGNDSFNYNDNFNHSTWLTFMKNRLELAKKFLCKEGVLFVHCDNSEQSYLKCLLDEIFGRDNFVDTVTVVNNPRGRDYGGIANMHEFIHIFTLNKNSYTMFKIKDSEKVMPFSDDIGNYETRELRNRNTAFHIDNRPNLCYPFYINPEKVIDNGFLEISLTPKDGYVELYPAKSQGIQTVWRWGKEKSHKNININIVGKAMVEDGRYMIVEKYRDNSRLARSVWWDKEVNSERGTVHLRELFGKKVFSFPKPETLISRILEISTQENDLILDFFFGSGTTASTAHKMGRRYIGIEQMDYINAVAVPRLQKVIDGEQGGISKDVDWQGGGSFVYCELKELNETFVEQIQNAKTDKELTVIKASLLETGYISHKVDIKEISKDDNDYNDLSFENKQKFLLELIDKNKLYVNYCDIEDKDMQVSEAEKSFTNSFYDIREE